MNGRHTASYRRSQCDAPSAHLGLGEECFHTAKRHTTNVSISWVVKCEVVPEDSTAWLDPLPQSSGQMLLKVII